jgi:hypothetical protein
MNKESILKFYSTVSQNVWNGYYNGSYSAEAAETILNGFKNNLEGLSSEFNITAEEIETTIF